MSIKTLNRTWETTNTTGQGNLSLNGASSARWRTFASQMGPSDFATYEIEIDGTDQWEIGYCQIIPGTPDQLVRYLIEENSAGTTVPIGLPAGTHQVTSGLHAGDYDDLRNVTRNILVRAGFEYHPTSGFIIASGSLSIAGFLHEWTSPLSGPGAAGHTANTMHYVYLHNVVPGNMTPAIEVSTTPAVFSTEWNYWQKAGDGTRRLIGTFRADAAGAVHSFLGVRVGSQLSIYYEQTPDTQVFNGQSAAAWTKITGLDQFLPTGSNAAFVSVEMIFLNQNNSNKIGIDPMDKTTQSVEAGIYRQGFNANKDAAIIEDSNISLPTLQETPALYTRNVNNNGSTDYIINVDGIQINLQP